MVPHDVFSFTVMNHKFSLFYYRYVCMLVAIHVSSFCICSHLLPVLGCYLCFLLLSFTRSSSYILDTSPLLDKCFVTIFFQSVACLFMFLMESFDEQIFCVQNTNLLYFIVQNSCRFTEKLSRQYKESYIPYDQFPLLLTSSISIFVN